MVDRELVIPIGPIDVMGETVWPRPSRHRGGCRDWYL